MSNTTEAALPAAAPLLSQQLKFPFEQRLRAHGLALESGNHSTDFVMREFLRELLLQPDGPGAEPDCAALAARHEVLVDVAAGRHGMAISMEAMLTLEGDFATDGLDRDLIIGTLVVARSAASAAGLLLQVPSHSTVEFRPLSVRAVLEGLFTGPAAWAPWMDTVAIDLLTGHYGETMQQTALEELVDGLANVDTQTSAARMCITHNRLNLLRRLADIPLPDFLKAGKADLTKAGAATEAGQWLDVLANHSHSSAYGARTSFARQIPAFIKSPAAPVLAEILVKHDPGHQFIETMFGTPAHALVMQALMSSHLQRTHVAASVATQAANEQVGSPPVPVEMNRRRARHV